MKAITISLTLIALPLFLAFGDALVIEPASEAQISKIKMALGSQYPVTKILSVKSTNHQRAHYVGAAFDAAGVGEVIGVWLMSGPKEQPGVTLSVDAVAYEFSRMGKASESKAGGSVTDPEAKALKAALKN